VPALCKKNCPAAGSQKSKISAYENENGHSNTSLSKEEFRVEDEDGSFEFCNLINKIKTSSKRWRPIILNKKNK